MRTFAFKDQRLNQALLEMTRETDSVRKESLSNVTANHSLLLISPGLKVYEITVDDAGTLHTTKVAG